VDTLFVFFNERPPLSSLPLHLQSMVGRNGLFSGYKSQRTKGHGKKKKDRTGGGTKRDRTGKVLVPQPAANPRAFTAIVFVLNEEDWAETQTRKKNRGRGKESQNRGVERDTEKKQGDRGKPNRAQNKAKKKHRKKRKIKEQHSEGYWFSPLFLSLQKTQNQQPIHSRPASLSSSWFQKSLRKTKRKRRQSEHKRKIKGKP